MITQDSDEVNNVQQPSISDPEPIRTGDLQRDIIRLMQLKPEHYQFSFTGLRRSLGNVHQQQLTNMLDRLLEDSVLEKSQGGYMLLGNRRRAAMMESWADETYQGKPLLGRPLPVDKMYHDLTGKWFGHSRFMGGGYDRKSNSAVLEWIATTSNGQTRLKVSPLELTAQFRGVGRMERDKALNVFSEACLAFNNPVMFEAENQEYAAN